MKSYVKTPIFTVLAILVALLFALPLLWSISAAFRPNTELFSFLSPLSIHALIPAQLTGENIAHLFSGPFLRALGNSLLIAVFTIIFGVVISAMAAFALSAIEFRYREVIFGVVIVCFLIPFEAIALPLSDLFRDWGLRNTYAGLILPALANGTAIFLLRQFFLGIPKQLKEAALVDGAGWFTILLRIYVPLARPSLIGAGLIFFVSQWQTFLWPILIITDPNMNVAPIALDQLMGQYSSDFGQLFAGALVLSIVPIIVMLPLQRYFIQSIATTGGKE
jgi:putative chitobiose transport system permease protein